MYAVQCTPYNVRRTMYAVQCMPYNVRRTIYAVQFTPYNVGRTMYAVHCTHLIYNKYENIKTYISYILYLSKFTNVIESNNNFLIINVY